MELIQILKQHRNDFQGFYRCERCGWEEKDQLCSSYDDHNYHHNVIPRKKCAQCGVSSKELQDSLNELKHDKI